MGAYSIWGRLPLADRPVRGALVARAGRIAESLPEEHADELPQPIYEAPIVSPGFIAFLSTVISSRHPSPSTNSAPRPATRDAGRGALCMATAVPARPLNRERAGRQRAGADADLVLLDDALDVEGTMIRGEFVYHRYDRGRK